MGAKDWLLVFADEGADIRSVLQQHPEPDRAVARELAEAFFSGTATPIDDGTLLENANPSHGDAFFGCYPGLTVVATEAASIDRPATLHPVFLDAAKGKSLYLHAMHSVVDWFAFAVWGPDGTLRRSLSLSPDEGIVENIGDPLPFEKPYWAGEHPLELDEDDYYGGYSLPFHPLELAEDALRALFGFVYEGSPEPDDPDLAAIKLAGFRIR